MTVHPGIGYDIISNHPVFSGSAIGRGAQWDFTLFGGSMKRLMGAWYVGGLGDYGSTGVREEPHCAVNLRCKGDGRFAGHSIFVVDLQDGGGWDWTAGEPPKTNPAYYLRFCKLARSALLICAIRQRGVHSQSVRGGDEGAITPVCPFRSRRLRPRACSPKRPASRRPATERHCFCVVLLKRLSHRA